MKTKFPFYKCYTVLFAALFIYNNATAQVSIKTVIPAAITGNIVVTKKDSSALAFDLSVLPPGATVDSCKLQIVLLNAIPLPMVLDIRFSGAVPDSVRNNRINNIHLDASYKKDSVIRINVGVVFLKIAAAKNLKMILKTGIPNSGVQANFYPSSVNPASIIGYGPRLVVYYSLQRSLAVDWASSRANAQHTGQTYMRFRGADPDSFNTKKVAGYNDIQADLVMDNGLLYVTEQDALKNTSLYSIDPVTLNQTTIASQLYPPKTMPVIDPSRRLYYVSSNTVSVIDLNDKNKKTIPITIDSLKSIASSPSTGPDGTLYLPMNDIIYAYSPFPQHRLLWQYSLEGKKSPVTISRDGTIAYLISYRNNKIIAINTTDGRRINQADVLLQDITTTVGPTIPVIGNNGYIYVADKLIAAYKIHVFDKNLKKIRVINGTNISTPVVGTDSSVYYINNGDLVRSYPVSDSVIAKFDGLTGVRSLVGDQSNNVYCLGMDDVLYSYNDQSKTTTRTASKGVVFQRAMIIATDGSLYSATSSNLITIRPSHYQTDYTLSTASHDEKYNLMAFRGNNVIVPDSFILSTRQLLTGKKSIQFNFKSSIDKTANIRVITGGSISFKPGFSVKQGAVLSCKTGY